MKKTSDLQNRLNTALRCLFATLCLSTAVATSTAAEWPERPVKIISPYLAGGGLDIWVRPIANLLTQQLGQSFVVENKAGANGAIGTTFGARSVPDGYTIMAGTTGSLAMNAALKTNLPYDPIKDFAPVTIVAEAAFLMTASPSSNIKSLNQTQLSNIKIPLPPLSEQQKIVTEIEKIEAKIKFLEIEIIEIPKQKEAILKKYL